MFVGDRFKTRSTFIDDESLDNSDSIPSINNSENRYVHLPNKGYVQKQKSKDNK